MILLEGKCWYAKSDAVSTTYDAASDNDTKLIINLGIQWVATKICLKFRPPKFRIYLDQI
jgi:hypothetical protein